MDEGTAAQNSLEVAGRGREPSQGGLAEDGGLVPGRAALCTPTMPYPREHRDGTTVLATASRYGVSPAIQVWPP